MGEHSRGQHERRPVIATLLKGRRPRWTVEDAKNRVPAEIDGRVSVRASVDTPEASEIEIASIVLSMSIYG